MRTLLRTAPVQYGFFDPGAATLGVQFSERYKSAQPFPHIIIDGLVDDEVLALCLDEFPEIDRSGPGYHRNQENLKFEIKPEALSPRGRSFFYSLNSQPFLGFLEGLSGIQGLIPDPYFIGGGFHAVVQGGHLNIHADFNHHQLLNLERRINVLIYLNRDWKEDYGGCLELWDSGMHRCYERIVPLFNRCVIFNTSSDSFHGNPEPVNHPLGIPRRSIALYYYTATWDRSRREHTTSFQVRPNSTDAFDLRVKAMELLSEITPPIFLRALRKLRRQHTAQRTKLKRDERATTDFGRGSRSARRLGR